MNINLDKTLSTVSISLVCFLLSKDESPQNIFIFTTHYENTPIQIYSKISPPKTKKFSVKNSDIFHIFAQNIDCGYSLEPPRRGGSNEYPQSMFLSRNKKKMYTPINPSFTI